MEHALAATAVKMSVPSIQHSPIDLHCLVVYIPIVLVREQETIIHAKWHALLF